MPDVRYNVHMKKMLSATKARKEFFKLIEATKRPGRHITLTVDGEPEVVMMSYEDYEGWLETLDIMSDPTLMKGIKKGMEDSKNGRTYTEEQVKKRLAR